MENEMTNNETKKALENEIHLAEYVDSDYCSNTEVSLIKNTLDLINRLEAEVERLEKVRKDEVEKLMSAIDRTIAEAKTEAVKEFAEIVKANKHKLFNYIYSSRGFDEQIDNLAKETVGE